MAASVLQAFTSANQTTATPTIAVTGVTAGSTLVISCYMQSNNRTLDSMSGGSNTYAELHARVVSAGSSRGATTWYAYNVTSGNYTITLTMSASSTYDVACVELGGVTSTDSKDQVPAGEGIDGGQTLSVGPTGTLTQADEIALAFGFASVSARPFNAMSGWTQQVNLTNPYTSIWSQVVASTTALSAPLDTAPNNQFIIGFIATFLASGGGGGGGSTAKPLTLLGVG